MAFQRYRNGVIWGSPKMSWIANSNWDTTEWAAGTGLKIPRGGNVCRVREPQWPVGWSFFCRFCAFCCAFRVFLSCFRRCFW